MSENKQSTTSISDRRLDARADIDVAVRVAVSTLDGSKKLIDVELKNVSTSGLLLYSLVDLSIATELDVRIDLPGFENSLYAKAVIVRKQRIKGNPGYFYGCKIRLHDAENLSKVKEFVDLTVNFQSLFIDEDTLSDIDINALT